MTITPSYSLLAPPIQQALWRMGWTDLRGIQDEAIRAIRTTDTDLIISSPTASGKTEAAFLPILSSVFESSVNSVGAVYIGPLKALINDQFQRLETLCEYVELPVHRWHGDVPAQRKRRLLERPNGVLLITPESLESVFVNRSSQVRSLFGDLRFVVIDEFHALVSAERGRHLRSLLYRLEQTLNRRCRTIGLSATLGDWWKTYAEWLRPGESEQVAVVTDRDHERRYRLGVFTHSIGGDDSDGVDLDEQSGSARLPEQVVEHMLKSFGGRKALIFANSRSDVERYADRLNELSTKRGGGREFLVHHSSVSKEIREANESAMREARPCSIVCSATLELGIDVGSVDRVGQIGPPRSVSSAVQRLGRSGRRDGATSEMRIYVKDKEFGPNASLTDRLHLDIVRTVAVIELMGQRWVEPPDLLNHDLSTLSQQVLSVIKQKGGATARDLFDILVHRGAFRSVNKSTFTTLLRQLATKDVLIQVPTGELILGDVGERVASHYDFYSAFVTPREFRVQFGSQSIGTLPIDETLKVGDRVLLAGRRWEVVDIDNHRQLVEVKPATGRKLTYFRGVGGEIHPRVVETMHDVLRGSKEPTYLDVRGQEALRDARKVARESIPVDDPWCVVSTIKSLWFTWTGTRIMETLLAILDMAGVDVKRAEDVAIEIEANIEESKQRLSRLLESPPTAAEVASNLDVKYRRKYDNLLSEELLTLDRSVDSVDIEGALAIVRKSI